MKSTKVLALQMVHLPDLLAIKESMKAILEQVNIKNDFNHQIDPSSQSQRRNLRKCHYFSRGYCKQGETCQYIHPKEICERFLMELKCYTKNCPFIHPNW